MKMMYFYHPMKCHYFLLICVLLKSSYADWAVKMDGYPGGTAVDIAGNIIVAMSTYSADPLQLVDHNRDVLATIPRPQLSSNSTAATSFITKLSPTGRCIWSITLASSTGDVLVNNASLVLDSFSNIYSAVCCSGTLSLYDVRENNSEVFIDSTVVTPRCLVLKFDRDGRLVSNSVVQSGSVIPSISAALTPRDELVLQVRSSTATNVSFFESNRTQPVSLISTGSILIKLASNGTFLWSTIITGALSSTNSLAVDHEGNILCHLFTNVNPILGFTSTNGSRQTFQIASSMSSAVAKYSPDGNLVWNSHFTSDLPKTPFFVYGIDVDSKGNIYALVSIPGSSLIYISGLTQQNQTIATFESEFYRNLCLIKMESTGGVIWSTPMTGNFVNASRGFVSVTDDDGVQLAALFAHDSNFNSVENIVVYSTDGTRSSRTTAFGSGVFLALYNEHGNVERFNLVDTAYHEFLNSIHVSQYDGLIYSGTTATTGSITLSFGGSAELALLGNGNIQGLIWTLDRNDTVKLDYSGFVDQYCFFVSDKIKLSLLSYQQETPLAVNLPPSFDKIRSKIVEVVCKSRTCFISISSVILETLDRDQIGDVNFIIRNFTSNSYACRPFSSDLKINFEVGSLDQANQTLRIPTLHGYRHYLNLSPHDNVFFRARSPENDNFILGLELGIDFIQFDISAPRNLRILSLYSDETLNLPVQLSRSIVALQINGSQLNFFQNEQIVFTKFLNATITKLYLTTGPNSALLDMVALIPTPHNITSLLQPPLDIESEPSSTSIENNLATSTDELGNQFTETSVETETESPSDEFSIFGLKSWALMVLLGCFGLVGVLIIAVCAYVVYRANQRGAFKRRTQQHDGIITSTTLTQDEQHYRGEVSTLVDTMSSVFPTNQFFIPLNSK